MRIACFSIAAIVTAVAIAQTTQPVDRAALELRANQEFNRGQYAAALPMLQKLAELSKDQPDVLGPTEEKIRFCEKNLNGPGRLSDQAASAQSPSSDRKPHSPPAQGQVLETTIKELGNFDYDADKGSEIPQDVVQLNGHGVRLRGFMIPMDQAANITQFALVPDLFACCFGQPPGIQHTIVVNCPKGKAVSYYPDEIAVEGTLTVAEKRDEGFIVSIFEVEAASVKPAAK